MPPTALATRIIDHAALGRNVALLRAVTGVPLMAVVKADGFGHGGAQVARTALASGASWLGVATVDEALELRGVGITAPMLAWLVDPWSALADAVRDGVTLSCANVETLSAVANAAKQVGVRAQIHLELDTGMARGGSPVGLWGELCAAAALAEGAGWIKVSGLWSHLALATRPDPASVEHPLAAFKEGVSAAEVHGLTPADLHLANSAAALAHPPTRLSMVRIGAALYGIETVEGGDHGLEWAMRVVSRVTQLREASAGTGVGYGHEFVLEAPGVLALIPVGYGDGIPRELSSGGEVVINGRRFPVRGVVSMDQFVVDVTGGDVELGDEVVLLGSAAGEPDAAEWATLAGTLAHDILTGIGGRIARVHVNSPAGDDG